MIRYILLVLAVIYTITGDDSSPQLQINIPSLGLVQGEINPFVNNVRQFIGIPFAQPPIGTLRFKPPVPINNTSSHTMIYNATAAAHQGGFPLLNCIQISLVNSSIILGQEDCLYLDIFLPLIINNKTLLPVVIYIYGGGFQTSDPHNPSKLISLYQNIIYVTIRYRINIFGFMASTSLSASRSGSIQSSGLQGFEDQQMAIKWIRDNIQLFGGNPNSITLHGHSAGAISICLHLIAPKSQGLFQRAIIESGGCDITQIPLKQMEIIGDEISSHFCNLSLNIILCLQSIDPLILLQYVQSKDYLNFFTSNSIHPSIDGLIIPDSITNLFQEKKFLKNISLLLGTTNSEFGLFIAGKFESGWQIQNLSQNILSQWIQFYSKGQSTYLNTTYNPYITSSYIPSTLINYYGLTDALSTGIFQCPIRRLATYITNNENGSVYLYSFNYIPLSSPFVDLSQSVHGQELPFIFNTPNSSTLTQIIFPVNIFNENEQLLSLTMSLLWIRFIIHGNPNIPINGEKTNQLINQLNQQGGWPVYSITNRSSYLIFSNIALGNSSATIQLAINDYHSPTCDAWDNIVPNPNITKRCAIGYYGSNCSIITNNCRSNTFLFLKFNLLLFFVFNRINLIL